MDKKKKNNILIGVALIVINAVLWPLFLLPQLGDFTATIFKTEEKPDSTFYVQKTKISKDVLDRIDFNNLRNPFISLEEVSTPLKRKPSRKVKPVRTESRPSTTPIVTNRTKEKIQNKYVSRFSLKGISKMGSKYAATLQEKSGYSATSSSPSPYSYRFQANSGANTSARTYNVFEGDSVLGERIVKIVADSVTLTKNGLFYKVTFSGGHSVKAP